MDHKNTPPLHTFYAEAPCITEGEFSALSDCLDCWGLELRPYRSAWQLLTTSASALPQSFLYTVFVIRAVS